MAISTTVIAQATARASATHPLDPLTADEIAQASAILKSQRQLGQRVRFETVVLREPDKDVVLMFQPGRPNTARSLPGGAGQRCCGHLRGGGIPR